MAWKFNPFTGNLDYYATWDYTITSPNGHVWAVTIDNNGALITTDTNVPPGVGNPYGLLLTLTYPS